MSQYGAFISYKAGVTQIDISEALPNQPRDTWDQITTDYFDLAEQRSVGRLKGQPRGCAVQIRLRWYDSGLTWRCICAAGRDDSSWSRDGRFDQQCIH